MHTLSHLSRVQLFVTPRTIACQAPLSMGFSRQEYWSGLSFPPPGDLPDPSAGTEPASLYQFSSVAQLCLTLCDPWTAACQASLSITNSWSSLKLMSMGSVMPSNISSSVVPFSSCLQSFPASGSFPMSQFFTSGGQSIGVSASASSFQ